MAFEELEPSDPERLLEALALHGANLAASMGAKEVKLEHFRINKAEAVKAKPKRQSVQSMKANLGAIVAAHNAAYQRG
ncbi:MAG: hypothetical protein V4719_10070 [Planctomycetota bacterium]